MVPDDGEAAPPPGQSIENPELRAGARSDDAFAATVAPSTPSRMPADVPRPLATLADAPRARRPSQFESDQTVPGPLDNTLPPLPIVSAGHYKADHEVARGGMGRIVAAEDCRLGRPVALKELLDPSGDQLGRFQREALITARLQHPGIVPVYEAGRWPTGEPFFAMKLVSGRPLDRVIAEARTLRERLALLPRIAAATDAIAYAHSQRVIHRDLKPANVLIGDFGETVVIDWGLAKDLDATEGPESGQRVPRATTPRPASSTGSGSSTLTVAGAVMGTPAYMAPEQARGEPVDQRADVFALGAMLYHLLAGVPPYNARTATEVIAAAALGHVTPLSEREKGAPRDLVAIVDRAMAQLPIDRYPSAGELAHELRRFLTGQLVDAHRYTAAQKVARFVKKHRAAVTISALAILAFSIGGTIAVRRVVHERDLADYERRLAVTRRQAAEKLIDKMLSDVKDRLTQIGRLDLLANLGGEIRDYYGTLAKIPGGMPAADVDRMASAVDLVGLAERESGKTDQALKTWTEARAELVRAVGSDASPATQAKRRMIARFDFELGTIHQLRGKIDAAIASYTMAEHELDALRTEMPSDRRVLLDAADCDDRLGDLFRNQGKVEQAFQEYSDAKTHREKASSLAGGRPSEEVLALSTSHVKLGSVYQTRGESATALEEYRAAVRLRETLLENQPDNVEIQERVLDVQDVLAELQRQIGDDRNAIATYKEAIPVMEALARRDPTNTTWKRQRGNLLADLGFALLDDGDFKTGLGHLEVAIETQVELSARDPQNAQWQMDLSRSYTRAGDGHLYIGELDEGLRHYQQALEIRKDLVGKDAKSPPYRRSMAWSYAKLGNALAQKGDLAKALDAHEQALALREQLLEESPSAGSFKNELAASEIALGHLASTRDPKLATSLVARGLTRARELVASDPINNEWKETLTLGLLAHADQTRSDAKARAAALNEAIEVATTARDRAPENAHWPGLLAEAHVGLADLAMTTGDRAAAATQWQLARALLEPLATAGRLPAPRKVLLDRARAAH